MGVDYTLSLRPIDYSLWTSSPVRSLAADYPLTFWGHVFILFVITIQWALPHLLHSSFRQSRGRTGFRSFPQFTIVQLVLISSFLPKKIWISKIYFKSFMQINQIYICYWKKTLLLHDKHQLQSSPTVYLKALKQQESLSLIRYVSFFLTSG